MRQCNRIKENSMKEHPVKKTSLANVKNECRAYFNRAKYYNSEASWDIYHTKLSLYKKEIRTSKRRACASFCSRIESTAKASRLRRILAKSPASIFYLKTAADSWTESSHETIFHGCLVPSHIPTRWLDVKVIFIPKAGNPSHNNPMSSAR